MWASFSGRRFNFGRKDDAETRVRFRDLPGEVGGSWPAAHRRARPVRCEAPPRAGARPGRGLSRVRQDPLPEGREGHAGVRQVLPAGWPLLSRDTDICPPPSFARLSFAPSRMSLSRLDSRASTPTTGFGESSASSSGEWERSSFSTRSSELSPPCPCFKEGDRCLGSLAGR